MHFLGFDPFFKFHVLLCQFVKQVLVEHYHIFGLIQVPFKLVILQMPSVCMSLGQSDFVIHLTSLLIEIVPTFLQGNNLLLKSTDAPNELTFLFFMYSITFDQ